ncbi:hypothetical protein ILUMI_24502, partial [Ignelater luminosus]
MSQMIRYVHVDCNVMVMIEESFINLIRSHEKTGEGLSTEILNKLEVDKLNIQDLQGGKDLTTVLIWLANIREIDNLAIFVPCAVHNLNFAGVHVASTTPEEVQNLAEEMGMENGFLNKRKRRVKIMKIDETPDEG